MKPIALILVCLICFFNGKAEETDSTYSKVAWRKMVDIHGGGFPIVYGSKIGIGLKWNRMIYDFDYVGIQPFIAIPSRKVALSASVLMGNWKKQRKFIMGLTYMRLWEPDGNRNLGQLGGYDGHLIYPYMGYYNQQLAKSIFCLSIKIGALPLILNEIPGKHELNGFIVALDLTVGIRLYKGN